MSKRYLCKGSKNYVKKYQREKKVFYTLSGRPYIRWNDTRVYLDIDVIRLSYPVMYEDEHGKLHDIGAYYSISNCYGFLVEVLDGESVQLYTEDEFPY